jgi:hypothetical protein
VGVDCRVAECAKNRIETALRGTRVPTTVTYSNRVVTPHENGNGMIMEKHGGTRRAVHHNRIVNPHRLAITNRINHLFLDDSHDYAFLVEGAIITSF